MRLTTLLTLQVAQARSAPATLVHPRNFLRRLIISALLTAFRTGGMELSVEKHESSAITALCELLGQYFSLS